MFARSEYCTNRTVTVCVKLSYIAAGTLAHYGWMVAEEMMVLVNADEECRLVHQFVFGYKDAALAA
jgi:hypothetical protein